MLCYGEILMFLEFDEDGDILCPDCGATVLADVARYYRAVPVSVYRTEDGYDELIITEDIADRREVVRLLCTCGWTLSGEDYHRAQFKPREEAP